MVHLGINANHWADDGQFFRGFVMFLKELKSIGWFFCCSVSMRYGDGDVDDDPSRSGSEYAEGAVADKLDFWHSLLYIF